MKAGQISEQTANRIEAILDQEWLDTGLTPQQLQEMKQIAEIEGKLLASGRTIEGINAERNGKTSEQIIAEYASIPAPEPTRQEAVETDWLPAIIREVRWTPTPRVLFSATVELRNGEKREYEGEACIKDKGLLRKLERLSDSGLLEIRLRTGFSPDEPLTLIGCRAKAFVPAGEAI